VTHLLTGACLSRAGFNRKTALATLTMVLAAEVPDADILWYFKDPAMGFAHHRGFTHAFIGVPLDAALALGAAWFYWRFWKSRRLTHDREHVWQAWERPRWGLLVVLALVAALSHILLDFTNNYGVRPFFPLSPHWYSWDIVYIIEPVMLTALVIGLVGPALLRLINEEVGSTHIRKPGGGGGAIFAMLCIVALWGVRDYEHRRAVAALESLSYEQEDPLRVSAYPYWINPFEWHGVVETKDFFALVPVRPAEGEVDPQGRMQIRYKPEETPVTMAAKRSYLGRAFLSWAQYPMVEVEEHGDAHVVRMFDLRYVDPNNTSPSRNPRPLGMVVELDRDLNVIDEYPERLTR